MKPDISTPKTNVIPGIRKFHTADKEAKVPAPKPSSLPEK